MLGVHTTLTVGGLLRAAYLRRDAPADRIRVWPVRLAEPTSNARLLPRRHRRVVLYAAAGLCHRLLHVNRLQSLASKCQRDRQRITGTSSISGY